MTIALAAWALLSNPGAPGAVPFTATILVGVIAWVAGHQLAQWRAEAPGIAVAGLVAALMLASLPESLT